MSFFNCNLVNNNDNSLASLPALSFSAQEISQLDGTSDSRAAGTANAYMTIPTATVTALRTLGYTYVTITYWASTNSTSLTKSHTDGGKYALASYSSFSISLKGKSHRDTEDKRIIVTFT